MPCLCVSPPSGFSSPNLHRPHLSSPPACRICCLLTLVHLQSARFLRRCPETGNNSTALGLSLKLIPGIPILYTTVVPVVACVGSLPRHNHPRSGGGRRREPRRRCCVQQGNRMPQSTTVTGEPRTTMPSTYPGLRALRRRCAEDDFLAGGAYPNERQALVKADNFWEPCLALP